VTTAITLRKCGHRVEHIRDAQSSHNDDSLSSFQAM